MANRRPTTDEYAPYYAGYVKQADTDDIVQFLTDQKEEIVAFLRDIVWEKWELAYDTDKWTLGEVVLHIMDGERIFAYRALRIGRGDTTPLPGFDQDLYVPNCNAAARTPASIVDEFAAVREATVQLFKNFTEQMFDRRGTASNATVSSLALAYMIGGHAAHHMKIIRERYLV